MSSKSVCAMAAGLLLCACGTSSTPGVGRGGQSGANGVVHPAHAVWCPTTKSSLRQSEPNSPAPHSFDARTLLGQTEDRAAATAHRFHCSWRVIERDGQHFVLTSDLKVDRVNATVNHGRVTSIGVY